MHYFSICTTSLDHFSDKINFRTYRAKKRIKPHISIISRLRTRSSMQRQGQGQVCFINSQHCFMEYTGEGFLSQPATEDSEAARGTMRMRGGDHAWFQSPCTELFGVRLCLSLCCVVL